MMFRNSLKLERLARIQAVTKDLENNLESLENQESGTDDAQSPETRFSLSNSRTFKQW